MLDNDNPYQSPRSTQRKAIAVERYAEPALDCFLCDRFRFFRGGNQQLRPADDLWTSSLRSDRISVAVDSILCELAIYLSQDRTAYTVDGCCHCLDMDYLFHRLVFGGPTHVG